MIREQGKTRGLYTVLECDSLGNRPGGVGMVFDDLAEARQHAAEADEPYTDRGEHGRNRVYQLKLVEVPPLSLHPDQAADAATSARDSKVDTQAAGDLVKPTMPDLAASDVCGVVQRRCDLAPEHQPPDLHRTGNIAWRADPDGDHVTAGGPQLTDLAGVDPEFTGGVDPVAWVRWQRGCPHHDDPAVCAAEQLGADR